MEVPNCREIFERTVGFVVGYFGTLALISVISGRPFDPAGELRLIGLSFLNLFPGSDDVERDDR